MPHSRYVCARLSCRDGRMRFQHENTRQICPTNPDNRMTGRFGETSISPPSRRIPMEFDVCTGARPSCPTLRQTPPVRSVMTRDFNAKTCARRVRQTPTMVNLGNLGAVPISVTLSSVYSGTRSMTGSPCEPILSNPIVKEQRLSFIPGQLTNLSAKVCVGQQRFPDGWLNLTILRAIGFCCGERWFLAPAHDRAVPRRKPTS